MRSQRARRADRELAGDATTPDRVLTMLATAVPDLIDDAEVPVTTVLGLDLTTTGAQRGVREDLERRVPALWTSAAAAEARGEQWCGGLTARDFIYVHLGTEIDCAVVSYGQRCTGARRSDRPQSCPTQPCQTQRELL